jgi:two-component system response regulator HydG
MFVDHPLNAAPGGSGPSRYPTSVLDEIDITSATRSASCVLFTGGRTARLLAERIHRESGWGWGPFQTVDCGASAAALDRLLFAPLEADLWPADSKKPTLRLLQPGPIVLQDVDRLPSRAQVQLRDLLELAACEIPGRRSRRRIMASTAQPLLPRVTSGTFDETLFYRLNALHFVL